MAPSPAGSAEITLTAPGGRFTGGRLLAIEVQDHTASFEVAGKWRGKPGFRVKAVVTDDLSDHVSFKILKRRSVVAQTSRPVGDGDVRVGNLI